MNFIDFFFLCGCSSTNILGEYAYCFVETVGCDHHLEPGFLEVKASTLIH